MATSFYEILDFHVAIQTFERMSDLVQELEKEGKMISMSAAHKKYLRKAVDDGNTAEHGPGLCSDPPSVHQDSYAKASGDFLGPHDTHGDPKEIRELIGSWYWLFGLEAMLILIHVIRISGPPIIMEKQTLELWQKGWLRVEPHRHAAAWGKYSMNLNGIMQKLVQFGRLPEPGEASVFLYLKQQLKWPVPKQAFKTEFDKKRGGGELFPDKLLHRFYMGLDNSGRKSMWNRRYHGFPDWIKDALLKEEARRITTNNKYAPQVPEGTAEYMLRAYHARQKERVTGFLLDEAKKLFRKKSSREPSLKELNVSIGKIWDQLQAYWKEKVDFASCPSGVTPPSHSEIEYIRRNLSARQITTSWDNARITFPSGMITAQEREIALQFYEANDYSSGQFWPEPGMPGSIFDCYYD